jgi:phosphohistidine phosphatase
MKTLYLVRHAKSDWSNESILDIDRPLNAKGYREAYEMSLLLKEKNNIPDLIITSPAIRAYSTALVFSRNFDLEPSKIWINQNLYETSVKDYQSVIKQLSDEHNSVMLFGHNPFITDFSNSLITQTIENIPTCGIVAITNDCNNWQNFCDSITKKASCYFPS